MPEDHIVVAITDRLPPRRLHDGAVPLAINSGVESSVSSNIAAADSPMSGGIELAAAGEVSAALRSAVKEHKALAMGTVDSPAAGRRANFFESKVC